MHPSLATAELRGHHVNSTFKQLPDYPALKQLRESLNGHSRGRRAAVLVGAGFSRCGANLPAPNSAQPPLWLHFARKMWQNLYLKGEFSNADPLRLAQEYAVAFGDAAVDDLIRELVPDDAWQPGECHKRLMSLPWADVLTTNWDTLLERAARSVAHRPYSVVRTTGDMAASHAPRIVKLHGSLPSHGPFILTQEHFRRYPDTHAAFVNLARQVFIENELVLLGFSGEDPNFVQWAGWVRDHLGGHNRRLYLVGVLDIAPSRRQLFEKMNIAAIDLAPLVSNRPEELRHKEAHLELLKFLAGGQPLSPADWPYSSRSNALQFKSTVDDVRNCITMWTADREAYPGWVRCPHRMRWRITSDVQSSLHVFKRLFANLTASDQNVLMREVAWRAHIGEQELPAWLLEHLEARIGSMTPTTPVEERLDVALAIAMGRRELGDQKEFESALAALNAAGKDGSAWSSYLTALRCIERLDLERLPAAADGVKGEDPFWMVRRAGLVAQTGQINAARELYLEAFTALRARHHLEPTSQWISSRLIWADFLAARANMLSSGAAADDTTNFELPQLSQPVFRDELLDPWNEIDALGEELRKAESNRSGAELPKFEPGTYVRSIQFEETDDGGDGWPRQMRRLLEFLGSEGGIGNVTFFRSQVRRAAPLARFSDELSFNWALASCRQRDDKVIVDSLFSRVAIATWPIEKALELRQRVLSSCAYAMRRLSELSSRAKSTFDERIFFVERVAISFELLSRLSVRLDDQAAVEWYGTVLSWASEPYLPEEFWLHENYITLLKRAWRVLPRHARLQFGLEQLVFRLAAELPGKVPHYWRDVVDDDVLYSQETRASVKWTERLSDLFKMAESGSQPHRQDSIGRLFSLFRGGNLTDEEVRRLAAALWSKTGTDGLPTAVNLWHFVIFELPEVADVDPQVLFAARYFTAPVEGFSIPWVQNVIGSMAFVQSGRLAPPDAAVVKGWLDAALSWRPKPSGARSFPDNQASPRDISRLLLLAVFPLIDESFLSGELAQRYEAFCADVPEGVEAAYALAQRLSSFRVRGRDLVRSALWSSDRESLLAGVQALASWQQSMPHDLDDWRPLLESVVAACGVPVRLGAGLLWHVVVKLVPRVAVDPDLVQKLCFALDQLRAPSQYKALLGANATWQEEAPKLIAAAVSTAQKLRASGVQSAIVVDWIKRGETDPLPEVRHAGDEQ